MQSLLTKFGPHYILVMMMLTRVLNFVGGGLVIYYINLTIRFPPENQRRFEIAAAVLIAFSVTVTIATALAGTRNLRRALALLHRNASVPSDLAEQAGREAVLFAARHHRREAVLVPATTVVPLCIFMWLDGNAALALVQVVIAGFLGISTVLLMTFFASETWMAPVTRSLLNSGINIPFDRLPANKLNVRMNISFGLTVMVATLMIGALANQRATDIIKNPAMQDVAVANLREHTVYIMLTALAVGMVLAHLLSQSIAARVGLLLDAMKRVESGEFSQRIMPTGNDEIDKLSRQFNAMVEQLYRNDHVIRDLNTNLESKVKLRTKQLSKNRRSLKKSLSKLQEYDRLKTEFFSNISHELRTPLTMILAPVDRLLDSGRDSLSAQARELLNVVRLNGCRLLDLINRLLDFSKLEAGQTRLAMRQCDLNHLLSELVAGATPLAEQRGLTIKAEFDPELPLLQADEDKLDIIATNLISNAIKFTPEGGQIRLETLYAGDRVWVVVSDTGIGIDEADYDKVFERFVQLDGSTARAFAGTGLGLSLVKELVELHGGQIHLKSQLGKGCRFWFDIPLVQSDVVVQEAPSTGIRPRISRFAELQTCQVDTSSDNGTEPTAPGSATVLVVDDTPEMRQLIIEILREDYRVLSAADGEEGLALAIKELPDLIISDVMMPRMDGHEFCKRIKQNSATSQIPFVMLTAKANIDMKVDGLNMGADDYLTKPFDQKELKARARSLLKLRKLNKDLNHRNLELASANDELQSMQTQLVQAEKMGSLGQLVAGLAHEINNSINAVYNGIKPLSLSAQKLEGLIAARGADGAGCSPGETEKLFKKIYSLAGVIENGAARTVRIVSDLKTFSHPGTGSFDDFDLHESLDICLNLLFNQTKDRITVHKEYESAGKVHGPSGQLNQVFMNILHNALQAISGTGDIYLSTTERDSMVCVSIRDTGGGIPEGLMQKIFDPFFTTKAPGVGTGLGLSVSYGIIHGLGGSIECDSTIGVGTEFRVFFPKKAVAKPDDRYVSGRNMMLAGAK